MSFFQTQNHAREVAAEEREARRLAHLRESRTARFERLLDPRSHIGTDTVALDQQQRVKQLRAEAAAADKAAERAMAVATADAVAQLEREGEAARRARAAATAAALDAQAGARTARTTWDLEDPAALRRAPPTRAGLDDPRLGLSSAQVFVGEDAAARQRALLQQAQVRTWTAQMVGEKEARRAADRARDEAIAADMVRCAALAGEIEAAGVAEQRQRQRSAVLQNDALIADKRAQREREREEDRASGQLDAATLSSRGGMGLLAEAPEDGLLAGGRRYRADYFRGIPAASPQGAASALAQVASQVEARRARLEEERAADTAAARREAEELRAAGLRERELAHARAASQRATAAVLGAQVAAAEERRAREREERLHNRIGEDFYKGFGKAF